MASRHGYLTAHIKKEFFIGALKFAAVPDIIVLIVSIVLIPLLFAASSVSGEYYKINICVKNEKALNELHNCSRISKSMLVTSSLLFLVTFVLFVV